MNEKILSNKFNTTKKRKRGIKGIYAQIMIHLVVWITVVLVMFPFLITVMFSFKGVNDFNAGLWALPKTLQFSNYAIGFSVVGINMFNSLLACITIAVSAVLISSLSAYVFSRYDFIFSRFLYAIIIALMMVPGILSLTPSYLNVINLGLYNTRFAVILPGISANLVGGVFLFRTFMSQQPKDLFESARIDGAGDMIMYFKISLPLAVPIIIIQFIGVLAGNYNDYLWPLLVIDDDSIQMLMPIIRKLIGDIYNQTLNAGISYAIYLCSGIPLIITSLIGLKYFINGDFASGLKL